MSNKIVARECKFVVHVPKIPRLREDMHYIKELLHYEDGSTKNNIRIVKNFKRPFWVTKEIYRDHKQKKEYEDLDKLDVHTSIQSDLPNEIAKIIGKAGYTGNKMRDVTDYPYLYGTEISSEALIKKAYMDKYPDYVSEYNVAAYDIENDIDTGEISLISVVMEDRLYTAVNKKFLKSQKDVESKLDELYKKFMPESDIKSSIKFRKVEICSDELMMIKRSFQVADKWAPDFLAIWNIKYDIPHILGRLKKYGVDPIDIITDFDLPRKERYFKYKEGMTKKITESGKEQNIDWEKQWHYVFSTTKYILIDAACSYSQVRTGQAVVPGGYGLDNILNKHCKLGKLKFKDDEVKLENTEWHKHMTKHRFLEYIVYNQWDVMGMIELDNVIKDLKLALPLLAGPSSFSIFNSMPKKVVDDLHFFYYERGKVLGTRPSKVSEDKLLGLDNWIITLPAALQLTEKLHHVLGMPEIETLMTPMDYDVDAVSSYPSNIQAANVSRQTTRKQILAVGEIEKDDFKLSNINSTQGSVNAIEYCTDMYNFPSAYELTRKLLVEAQKDMVVA